MSFLFSIRQHFSPQVCGSFTGAVPGKPCQQIGNLLIPVCPVVRPVTVLHKTRDLLFGKILPHFAKFRIDKILSAVANEQLGQALRQQLFQQGKNISFFAYIFHLLKKLVLFDVLGLIPSLTDVAVKNKRTLKAGCAAEFVAILQANQKSTVAAHRKAGNEVFLLFSRYWKQALCQLRHSICHIIIIASCRRQILIEAVLGRRHHNGHLIILRIPFKRRIPQPVCIISHHTVQQIQHWNLFSIPSADAVRQNNPNTFFAHQ